MARHVMLAAAALLLFAANANAQVCKDKDAEQSSPTGGAASTNSTYFVDCDMSYKYTELMCDTRDVRGSCPADPMMMRTTPKKSFIKDFSPFLYAYARDPEDKTKPYTGLAYRGTAGNATLTFGIVCPPGRKCPASCKAQIKFNAEAKSPEEEAKMVRLQLDNCTNQYILNTALTPYQKENSTVLCGENDDDGSEPCKLKHACQPLATLPDTKNEYYASDYLKAAWIKLMQDPKYRKNPKAAKEPHLPDGVKIENPIPPPSPFPDVRVSSVGAVEFEEINDPTHPFSPRWDFEFNERDHYSPMTQSYSKDPQNAVFCAGDKDKQILKVDILSFREASLKFDDKITKRIDFNKNCMANTGPQKNPCCKVQGLTCKLMPCKTCYGMTAEAPVCSTNYITQPDRKRVKAPYLSVHPALRVVGAIQSLSSLSLSNLNSLTGGVLNVAQATGILSSQLNILNALPGNLPFSQVLPLLNGQVNLMQALPNIAPNLLSTALGGQAALLKMLPGNLTPGQLTGLLTGQGNVLGALQSATGLPLRSAVGLINSSQSLLNGMPSGALLADARRVFGYQTDMVMNLARQGQSAINTINRLDGQIRALENVNPDVLLSDAANYGAQQGVGAVLDYRGLGLPGNMSVGQARNVLGSTARSLENFDPNGGITEYSTLLNSQTARILGMPQDIPVTQIANMLNSTQGMLSSNSGIFANGSANGLLNQQNLGQITGVFNSQVRSLTGLPVNLRTGDLNALITGQATLMQTLGGAFNPNQIANMLTSQLGDLGKLANMAGGVQGLASALTSGNVAGLLNSQIGALSNLPGVSQLSAVAGLVDGNILGGVPGLGGLPGPSAKNTLPTLVVLGMPWTRTAKCNPNEFGETNSRAMAQLCRELRAPFAPLNKLKMRYHNPNEEDKIVLKEGVPEGYTFHEYFKDDDQNKPAHMPYPRLWDTGRSIQKTASDQQDPRDDSGQWTAIVGVGHEATPGNVEPPSGDKREDKAKAMRMKDQRCMYGGWGGNVSMGGASITLPDPIASWTELKLYQTRTMRDWGLSCIGRYEKTVKLGANEEKALFAYGADPTMALITRKVEGKRDEYLSYPEVKEKGADPKDMTQLRTKSHPLGWRGYIGETEEDQVFPKVGGSGSTQATGLDNAEKGDILIMENGASGTDDKLSLPNLSYVDHVEKGKFVYVREADNGKWPDVCGATDTWGEVKTRYLYKPGNFPKGLKEELDKLNWTTDCADNGLSACEAKNWSEIKIYRPAKDVRTGNSGEEMKEPAKPTTPTTGAQ